MTKRPTTPPLSKAERAQYHNLTTQAARALDPANGNRLIRLRDIDTTHRDQERRVIGGLERTVHQLRQQLAEAEAKLDALTEFADRDQDGLCYSHLIGQLRQLLGPSRP